MKRFKEIAGKSKSIIIISLLIIIIITYYSVTNFFNNKNNLIRLIVDESHSLLETIAFSSQQSIAGRNILESHQNEKYFSILGLIANLQESNKLSDAVIQDIKKTHHLNKLRIISVNNSIECGDYATGQELELSEPLFNNLTDTLINTFKDEKGNQLFLYSVTLNKKIFQIAAKNTAVNDIRKITGLGRLFKQMEENKNILFISLQDSSGIIAGAGNLELMSDDSNPDVENKYNGDSHFGWKITQLNDILFLEAKRPLVYENRNVGIIKIGLSLELYEQLLANIRTRIIISGIILLVVGVLFIIYFFVKRDLQLLEKKYTSLEKILQKVFEHTKDGIVVYNQENKLLYNNQAIIEIFESSELAYNILLNSECSDLLKNAEIKEIKCEINKKIKNLIVSSTKFFDELNKENTLFVIRDITELKILQQKAEKQDRLTAMGELASGVAHEIRNPLNSISTIIQQLNKDFIPVEYQDTYNNFLNIVLVEINRINKTVGDFLMFAKPFKIIPAECSVEKLIIQLYDQFVDQLKQKNINIVVPEFENKTVYWDKDKIYQVMINLLKNAEEAIEDNGEIKIAVLYENDLVKIIFKDNGKGIPEEYIDKIFNLYFTTKPSGTGIGLSIVQKIVFEHNGNFNVNSNSSGTEITLILPEKIVNEEKI